MSKDRRSARRFAPEGHDRFKMEGRKTAPHRPKGERRAKDKVRREVQSALS